MHAGNDLPLPLPEGKWNHIAESLKLTPRQKWIVELILCAKGDKEIAAITRLGKPTIRSHVERVFRRAGIRGRLALVLLILRLSHGIGPDV